MKICHLTQITIMAQIEYANGLKKKFSIRHEFAIGR